MASFEAGSAFVTVMPAMRGFQRAMRAQTRALPSTNVPVKPNMSRQAVNQALPQFERAGKQAGSGYSRAMNTEIAGGARAMQATTRASTVAAANAVAQGSRTIARSSSGASTALRSIGTASTAAAGRALRFASLANTAFSSVRGSVSRMGNVAPAMSNFTRGLRSGRSAAADFATSAAGMGAAASRGAGAAGRSISRFGSQATGALGKAGYAMGVYGTSVRKKMQGPMTQTLGFMGKFAGLAGLAGVAKGAFTASMSMDQTKRSLKGITGSGKTAADMMARIKNLSERTPIDASAYEDAAKSLAYMGVTGSRAIKIMENIGKATTVQGTGAEGLRSANDALLDMVNTGKVYAEQLNRISATGVPVIDALATKYHTTNAAIREMVQKGKIGVEDVLDVIQNETGPAFQKTAAAAKEAANGVQGRWQIAMNKLRNASGEAFTPIVAWVADTLIPAFTRLFEFIQRNQSWLTPLAIGLGLLITAFGLMAIAVWAFNAAMAFALIVTSPISWIVLAIGAAIAALIAGIYLLVTNWSTIWNAVGAALQWVWTNILQPVLSAIGSAFTWLYRNVLAPIGSAIGAVFRTIGSIFAWLWNNILHPIVNVWMALFRALYTIVVLAVFTPIILTIRAVGAAFSWLWSNAIGPAVRAIGSAAKWLWNNAIGPAFRAIGSVAKWLYNNAIKPAFDGIGTAANWVWQNILKPVFHAFGSVIDTVGRAFQSFGRIVKGIWGGIKDAVKGGVQMVIDIVWNNSLRKVAQIANKIPWVGNLIPDKWVNNPIKLARGGVVPGYNPGKDTVPAMLSAGEAVLVPEAVRGLGTQAIDAINAAFGGGRVSGTGPGNATGGFALGGTVRRFANGGVVPGGGKGAGTGAAQTPVPGAGLDPATLAAASAAAAQLNQVALVLNTTLLTLRTTLLALNTTLLTVTATVNTQHVPALIRLGVRLGVLGQQTMALQLRTSQQWALITRNVTASHAAMNRSQNSMNAYSASSWDYIARVVGASVSRQNAAFRSLNNGMGGVRNAMKYTADWADWAYGRIREAAAAPVRWVLNWPFNRGIIAAWNKLNKDFGFNKHVTGVPVGFASGGKVIGPGTGTSDSVPAQLSRGEFVVRESIAKRALPFLRALNNGNIEAVRATGGPRARLAEGGMPADTGSGYNAAIMRGMSWLKQQKGKPYVWGGVGPRGYDCSGLTGSLANVLRGQRHPYHRIGTTASEPWPGFKRGLKSAYGVGWNGHHTSGTLSGTKMEARDFGIPVLVGSRAAGAQSKQFYGHAYLPTVGGQFVGGGGGDIDPQAIAKAAFKHTSDLIGKGRKRWAGNTMGEQSLDIAEQARKRTMQAAIKKLEAIAVTASGATAGSPEVVAAVRAVARKYGWGSGAQWNALSWIIGKESGWNPSARNPTSSASGLFQKMVSVHGPLESTVSGQAKWGIRYMKNRYGSPLAAKRYWQAHGNYDDGGIARGRGVLAKNTADPERVLSPQQTRAFDRLVSVLGSDGMRLPDADRRDGGPMIENLYATVPQGASVDDLASAVNFTVRHSTKSVHGR